MSIRLWSEDYVSGFPIIDEQHKNLFHILNTFADRNERGASNNDLMAFLDEMWEYGGKHFSHEEALMAESAYPLLEYHANIHRELEQRISAIKDQLKVNALKEPYTAIISYVTDWLNEHIARDDLIISGFYKNRDNELCKDFIGRECEVATFNNETLGSGRIESVEKNIVTVANTVGKRMQVTLSDIVKISSFSEEKGMQVFTAVVFCLMPGSMKIFDATLIRTETRRRHFRVPTNIKAILWTEKSSFPVTITNMSVGGLRIETEQEFAVNKIIAIEFVVQNNKYTEFCTIVRTQRGADALITYGLKFDSLNSVHSDKLGIYIFNRCKAG